MLRRRRRTVAGRDAGRHRRSSADVVSEVLRRVSGGFGGENGKGAPPPRQQIAEVFDFFEFAGFGPVRTQLSHFECRLSTWLRVGVPVSLETKSYRSTEQVGVHVALPIPVGHSNVCSNHSPKIL